jgi:glucose/arabinose dehydrogenase
MLAAVASPSPAPSASPTTAALPVSSQLVIAAGFSASIVATVSGAREIAALPNGDLLVATSGATIAIVPSAESTGIAGTPATFATIPDIDAAGITYAPNGSIYVGSTNGVWQLGYTTGAQTASSVTEIAHVRTGSLSPDPDDQHTTTSVAATPTTLYASVGSDCNACAEVDPTRATIQAMGLNGAGMQTLATRVRNAIALTIDPTNGHLWAGGADQDDQPFGHPYEWMDDVASHATVVDYGWPVCYEDHTIAPIPAGLPATSCNGVTIPAFVLPAYSTIIGATFYPPNETGAYAFPAAYAGGLFLAAHGSWHNNPDGTSAAQPLVAYVPFAAGIAPATPVNWANPATQWQPFLSGFGTNISNRIGRPTGITVGSQGSLFIADDQTGNIYRMRPAAAGSQAKHRPVRGSGRAGG